MVANCVASTRRRQQCDVSESLSNPPDGATRVCRMAYTAQMTSDAPTSARDVRQRYVQAERTAARLRLLASTGVTLARQGVTRQSLTEILNETLAFLALESGAILVYEHGALTARAAVGQAPPAGTQVAPIGALATALRSSSQPVLREKVVSCLRIGRDARVRFEALIPLVNGGSTSGLLGLTSAHPVAAPDDDDLHTLEALGGILASALQTSARAPARSTSKDADQALSALTPRERQVFALLPRGLTNAAIAERLGIAPGTVKVHVERILAKLGLAARSQAAVKAAELGYSA